MARHTEVITITTEGRDKGKAYLLTEMPARQAEAWANRALLAIGRSAAGVDVDKAPAGMAGFYHVGATALSRVEWKDAEPLLAEMFRCIKIIADPERPDATTRELIEDDIEEVATRWLLREKVISLHLGFSLADRLSIYRQVLSASFSTSPNTSTSASQSGESSAQGSQPSTS